jgi:hypothetical protein
MPFIIDIPDFPDETLFATIERISDGYFWDNTTSGYAVSPSLSDKKISLTQGSNENKGSYTASISGLGSGKLKIRIHDDADSDIVISMGTVLVDNGVEVTGYITSGTLEADAANEIADAILSRNVSNVEATAPEHSLATIILATLESSIAGSTWKIKRTNGTTVHASKTVTTDPNATPITAVD